MKPDFLGARVIGMRSHFLLVAALAALAAQPASAKKYRRGAYKPRAATPDFLADEAAIAVTDPTDISVSNSPATPTASVVELSLRLLG
jgi:hypothetical protein